MSLKTQTFMWILAVVPERLAEIVEEYLKHPAKSLDGDIAFYGYWELCIQITDHNSGLRGACFGRHVELVHLMISYGADNWDGGLRGACYSGDIELAELMISLGAKDFKGGLKNACCNGHIILAQLMIAHGATNYDDGLEMTCFSNHAELMRLMIACGANPNRGLRQACALEDTELILKMITFGATKCCCGKSIENHLQASH